MIRVSKELADKYGVCLELINKIRRSMGIRLPYGPRLANRKCKLNVSKVKRIRFLYENKGWSVSDLSRKYDVNWSTISSVVNCFTWKHVE